MKISRLLQLMPFFTEFQIEQFIVRAAKDRTLQVQICHRTRSLVFGSNVFVLESADSVLEGPQLQSLQSRMMSSQLGTLSHRLREAVEMIDPVSIKQVALVRRAAVYDEIHSRVRAEHRNALTKLKTIEDYKEKLEAVKEAVKEGYARKKKENSDLI